MAIVTSLVGVTILSLLVASLDISGVRLYEARKFGEAERAFRESIKKRPQDPNLRLYLARTLIELNRISEALAELERVIEAQTSPEIEVEVGRLLRNLAERRFRDLSQSDAGQAGIHEIAGRRLEHEGHFDAALMRYREAQRLEPNRPGLSYAIGSVFWKMRELEEAERHLRAELERTPEHGMANFRLGQVLVATNREMDAVVPLERAAAALPDRLEVRRELGKAYRKAGRTADALAAWEAIARARPDDNQVHFLLGSLYRELGQTAAAEREFSQHRKLLKQRRDQSERP